MLLFLNRSILSSLALLLLQPFLNHAIPTNLEEARDGFLETRGGTGGVGETLFNSVVIGLGASGANSGLLKAFGSHSPTCCDRHPATDNCLVNAGTDAKGKKWMVCYFAGSEMIHDFDVAAMKCIINLHYKQRDACIDIKGSVCAQGYGGGLMDGQMSWIGKGHQKADQITSDQSVTYQAAAESMLNVTIDYTKGSLKGNGAMDLELVNPKAGQFALTEGMYFDGHMGGDC